MPELPMGEASQSGITSLNPMDGQSRNATIAIVYIGAAVTVTTDENGCAASVTVSAGEMAMQQLGDIPQMPGDMSAGAERDGADPEFADDASGEGE